MLFFCEFFLFWLGECFQIYFSLLTKCVGSRFLSQIYRWMDLFFSDLLLDGFVLLRSTFLLVHFFLLYSWAPSRDLKIGNHFSFLLFFYLIVFLSIIFLFDAYFSLISTYFCFIFLLDQCFPFISTFLLIRDLVDLGFSFISISLLNGLFTLRFLFPCILFDEFFFFLDLPFFWLMFFSGSLEQLDEYKKGNKNSVFFSFFYHLLISTLFSSIIFFMDIFL